MNLESSENKAIITNMAQALDFKEFGNFKFYTQASDTLGGRTCTDTTQGRILPKVTAINTGEKEFKSISGTLLST